MAFSQLKFILLITYAILKLKENGCKLQEIIAKKLIKRYDSLSFGYGEIVKQIFLFQSVMSNF